MKLCAVEWCAAFAVNGEHCPVHAKMPTLRPDYLAPGEEFVEAMEPCTECKGTGKCNTCQGSGQCGSRRTCLDCDASIGHECGHCEGSGKCEPCDGEGRVTHRKKREAIA